MRTILSIIITLAFAGLAEAQNLDSVPAVLTRYADRVWVKEKERVFLGEAGCSKGETWSFLARAVIARRVCEDRKFRIQQGHWSVIKNDVGDDILHISGVSIDIDGKYDARIVKRGAEVLLILESAATIKSTSMSNVRKRIELVLR